MEWEIAKSKKKRSRPKVRGRMATHKLARKEMAEEIARVHGRKRRDPRLEAVERAAEAWHREKEKEEFRKRREEQQKTGSLMGAMPIKEIKVETKIKTQSQDLGIVGWLQQGLARWAEKNPESKKKERRPNSATMAVILRKAVAREKALALGRNLPDPRVIALKQEAARWRESKEEMRRGIRREIGMLRKLIQLVARDRFFNENKKDEEWNIGRVSCFVDKVSPDGWNFIVATLEKSSFMTRQGWRDLLGIYRAELDDHLNLKNYTRVTPKEIEEYLNKTHVNSG